MQNLEVVAQKMAKLELFLSSGQICPGGEEGEGDGKTQFYCLDAVSYTHLRAHET